MAVTEEDSLSTSGLLSSSISSLSSSRHQASQIAKTYRQAAQLFLTRRLPEALSTIEPIISPQTPDYVADEQNGEQTYPAPVAAASRATRIKVWSFYLTFLNSVVELGQEEGKHAFGIAKWKALVSKCRDGSIWEDIVGVGYGGVEGDVDAEVVINLATLLLTHSPSQKLNQQRLETYLAASSHPTFDISSHMESSLHNETSRNGLRSNGTSTPRDLQTRLKLLELYTLHILPMNDEWDYAREFIGMSEVLDDDRKEAFLLALHGLREEQRHAALRESELRRQQQDHAEQRRREEEEATRSPDGQPRSHGTGKGHRGRGETEDLAQTHSKISKADPETSNNLHPAMPNGAGSSDQSQGRNHQQHPPTSSHRAKGKKDHGTIRPRPPRLPAYPDSFLNRASAAIRSLQSTLANTAQSMTQSPILLIRTLLFMFALMLMLGRRDIREKMRRILRDSWAKVRRTAGMGVKVSYL